MNKRETREKIVEIILNTEITGIKLLNITGGITAANEIADKLIDTNLRFGTVVDYTAIMNIEQIERINYLERELSKAIARYESAEDKLSKVREIGKEDKDAQL